MISETGPRAYQEFFGELRRLGEIEGINLTVERYSGEGRPEGLADLAREVVNRNPDVIGAVTNPVALAVRAATDTLPIVWTGVEPIRIGLATSLARPGATSLASPATRATRFWESTFSSSKRRSLRRRRSRS